MHFYIIRKQCPCNKGDVLTYTFIEMSLKLKDKSLTYLYSLYMPLNLKLASFRLLIHPRLHLFSVLELIF